MIIAHARAITTLLFGLGTAAAVACGAAAPTSPSADQLGFATAPDYQTPAGLEGTYQILWTGDILEADAAQRFLDEHGYDWPFARIAPRLRADFLVGNAEGPITLVAEPYFPDETWSYQVQPASADALARAGFGALSLANNHSFDRGAEGLLDSLMYLETAGIQAMGAGHDLDEALRPAQVVTPFGTVAIIGFNTRWPYGQEAGPDTPGTLIYTDDAIVEAHDRAVAAGARFTVAFVHWGDNYALVNQVQRETSQRFAQAGYTLVVGHHPHVPQPVDMVDGMPVVYSLGNFTFGTAGRFTAEFPGRGLLMRSYFGPDGLRALRFECLVTDNRVVDFQPRLCQDDEAERVIAELGPLVRWRDGAGEIAF